VPNFYVFFLLQRVFTQRGVIIQKHILIRNEQTLRTLQVFATICRVHYKSYCFCCFEIWIYSKRFEDEGIGFRKFDSNNVHLLLFYCTWSGILLFDNHFHGNLYAHKPRNSFTERYQKSSRKETPKTLMMKCSYSLQTEIYTPSSYSKHFVTSFVIFEEFRALL